MKISARLRIKKTTYRKPVVSFIEELMRGQATVYRGAGCPLCEKFAIRHYQ